MSLHSKLSPVYFKIHKHHKKPYHIKHQHQETANHSKHSFANCYWLDTNIQHLHNKTKVVPIDTHLKLYATQFKQLTQTQTHPLHVLNTYTNLPRNMKATIFYNNGHTNIIISDPNIATEECGENLKHFHMTITSQYLSSRKNNKVTNTTPHLSEPTLPHHICQAISWHLRKQVRVIAYPMYSASVAFLRVRRINTEIKKKKNMCTKLAQLRAN